MQPLINWIRIADIGMPPDVLELFLIGQKLQTGPVSDIWVGTNAFDSTQKFVLQLRPNRHENPLRTAMLVSESLGENDERIPRPISHDQLADAAGQLGFEWFLYLALNPAKVIISEEPPPIEGVEVFPARQRNV